MSARNVENCAVISEVRSVVLEESNAEMTETIECGIWSI